MAGIENLVDEIKKVVSFKETTVPGDLVIFVSGEPQAVMYALVRSIEKDESRKDRWWHVDMHLLTLPPQPVILTLREEQFTGREIFTMQGVPHFIQAVTLESQNEEPLQPPSSTEQKKSNPKLKPFSRVK